jgi:predicted ATPase
LRDHDEEAFRRLVDDATSVLPQLLDIDFEYPSGAAREVVIVLRERGIRRATPLADASYGTIRLLGILALLYDPEPPALTCVEEIDHGLHPQALELLVERLREASRRTQFLIATHSPALTDRLHPEELIVCERCDDGSSATPAVSRQEIQEIVRQSEGLPLGILEKAVQFEHLGRPTGTNRSWNALCAEVQKCCSTHIP